MIRNFLFSNSKFVLTVCSVFGLLLSANAQLVEINRLLPEPSGDVYKVEQHQDKLYMIGNFVQLNAPNSENIGIYDEVTNQFQSNQIDVNGEIFDIISDNNGGWFLGGKFTEINGVNRPYIAHIDANYNVLPFSLNATNSLTASAGSAEILSLLKYNDTLYVAGNFSSINGQNRGSIAAFDLSTGNLLPFNVSISNGSFPANIQKIALYNGKIFIGGNFNFLGGLQRLHAAAVAVGSGNIESFNPILNNTAFDFGFRGDTVFIGGSFSTVNTGIQQRGICAVNENTGFAHSWGNSLAPANNNTRVKQLIIEDSLIYIAGKFDNIGATARSSVAAIRISDGSTTAFDAQINSNTDVNCLAIDNNDLYIGGRFVGQNGSLQNIGKLNRFTGQKISSFDFMAQAAFTTVGLVNSIAIQGNEVLFGGGFPSIGGKLRNRFAVLDLPSGRIDDFAIDFNDLVRDFEIDTQRNAIFFSGAFISVDGNSSPDMRYFVGYDLSTKTPLSLNQNITFNNVVNSFEIYGDSLYFAGSFTSINGVNRRYLAAYDLSSNSVTPWFPSQYNNSSTPGISMGNIILSKSGAYDGYMILSSTASQIQVSTSIDGTPFPASAAPDVSTFGNGIIRDALFFDDEVMIVGSFSGRVRRYQGGTLVSSNFISGFTEVNAVTMKNEKIIFGGDFTSPNLRFAVLDKNTGNFIAPQFTRNARLLGFDKKFDSDVLYMCGSNSSLERNVEEVRLNAINIQSLSSNNLCPGGSFQVNFTVDFALQAGTTFELEISDINGDFNNQNPSILGSLSSTTGGSLTAVLPSVIPAGNYRLRIRASGNQLSKVLDSGFTILSLPAPSIALSSANFCIGDSLTLSTSSHNSNSFTWFKNGIQLSDTLPGISTTDSGFYQLVVSDTSGCSSDTAFVQLDYSAPIILSQIENFNLCPGDDLLIKPNVTGTNNVFEWFKNGSILANTADSLPINNASLSDTGSYQFIVSNVTGCADSSNIFTIRENPLLFSNDSNLLYRFSLDSTLVSDINGERMNFFFPGAQNYLNVNNRFGRSASAMSTQNNSSYFQIPEVNNDDISIAFWVYLNNNNASFTTLLSTNPATVPPVLINHSDNNKIGSFFGGAWTASSGNSGIIPINTWKHIAYTANGNNYKIYVDGDLVLSGTNGVSHNLNPLARLGNNNPSNVLQGLQGAVDDIHYYNRILTDAEVKVLFDAPEILVRRSTLSWCEGDSIVLSTEVFPSNPNYEYKWLLNGSLIAGADSSHLVIPSLNDANVGEYTALVGETCDFGRSLISRIASTSPLQHRYLGDSFNDIVGNNTIASSSNISFGTNHLNMPNSAFWTTTSSGRFLDILPVKAEEITVSMWINRGNIASTYAVLFTSGSSGEVPLLMNNQGTLGIFTNAFVPSTATLAPQVWYHIVFVANGNSNIIYVDGVEVLNISNGINFNTRPLVRFLNNVPANIGQGYIGLTSDIQIYTKALTPAEITLIQGVAVNEENIFGCNGQNLNLEVTSSLDSNTSFQWFVNDTAINGANSQIFQLNNLSSTMEGQYRVQASNGCIGKSSEIIPVSLIPDSLKFAQHKYEGNSYNDLIGNNDLTNTPSMLFNSDHLGRPAKSFFANSANNYLDLAQGIGEERASISFWINRSGGQDATILGSNVSNQSHLVTNSFGALGIRKNNAFVPAALTLANNTWHHIVVTFEGSKQKIYANGNLIFDTNDGINLTEFPIQRLFNNIISTSQFIGSIANIEIYYKTITANEVPLVAGFSNQPLDVYSCGNGNITLEATLSNPISVNAQWFKNGNPVVGQDSIYLNIINPNSSDSGIYRLEASVECLSIASEEAQVVIDSGASITPIHAYGSNGFNDLIGNNNLQAVNVQATAGAAWMDGAFNSTSINNGYMDITPVGGNAVSIAFWLRRNGAANFTTLLTGATNGDVHLLMNNAGDIGIFTSNFFGSTGGAISLNTWHHVVYVAEGSQNTIYVDGVERFSTTAGVDISSRPIGRLMNNVVANFNQGLNGSIGDIKIFDLALSADEAKLLAGFSSNLNDTTLCAGEALDLSVNTFHSGNFDFNWFKNGNLIANLDSNRLSNPIPNVSDTGVYTVRVSAGCIGINSDSARVNILSTSLVIDAQPNNTSFCEGDSLNIGFSSSSMIDSIQWFEVGLGALSGQNQANLDLTQISGTGDYFALLSNNCEQLYTDTVNITKVPQFSITNAPTIVGITEICENTSFSLLGQTSITGLNYDWLKDGISLGVNSSTYNIASAQLAENGIYSFVVSNSCFTDTAVFANLNVGTATSINETETACSNFVWRGSTYTQSGNYTDTIVVANACDTIFNLSLTILGSDSSSTSITSCTPTLFLGTNLNATGIYDITTTNILGCDSVVTVNFTLDNQIFTQLNETACDNYNFNGNLLSNSGTFADTIQTTAGCDSIVTLNLSIFNSFTDSISRLTCNSYIFDGITYTNTGIYPVVFSSVNGCDSTVVLDLTIDTVLISNFVEVACDSFSFSGQVYNTSGIYVDSLLSVDGCDSLVILDLTINNSANSLPEHAYPGNGFADAIGNNNLIPTAGISLDIDHLGRANSAFNSGSTNNNFMDINPIGGNELTVTFWLRRSSNATFTTLMQSNTTGDVHLLMNNSGSIGVFTTNFFGSAPNTIALNTWYHIAYVANGDTNKIYVDGTEVFSTNNGVNTATRPITRFLNNTVTNIGQGLHGSISDIKVFNEALPMNEIQLMRGFSSLNTDTSLCAGQSLSLTANMFGSAVFQYQWIKDSSILPGATNAVLNLSGFSTQDTGVYTTQVIAGCKSITSDAFVLSLEDFAIETQAVGGTFCENDPSAITFTTSGNVTGIQWYDEFGNPLTGGVQNSLFINQIPESGNYYAEVTGSCGTLYTDTIAVTIIPDFSIINAPSNVGLTQFCAGSPLDLVGVTNVGGLSYEWFKGNLSLGVTDSILSIQSIQISDSGSYRLVAFNNCFNDTALFAQVAVVNEISVDFNETACGSFDWRGNTYNQSGIYRDTVASASGCDSVFTLNLNVIKLDTSVSISEITLTAGQNNANYQWVDCDNDFAVITGATAQSYTPAQTGNYAVIVSQGACNDTSACYEVVVTNVATIGKSNHIMIYPNPTSGIITIEVTTPIENQELIIRDLLGRIIVEGKVNINHQLSFDLSSQSQGVYFLSLKKEDEIKHWKFVIK